MTPQTKQSRILKIVKSEDAPAPVSETPNKISKQKVNRVPKALPITQKKDDKAHTDNVLKATKILITIPPEVQEKPIKRILPHTPRRIQDEPVNGYAGIMIVAGAKKNPATIDCNSKKMQNILITQKEILTANLPPEILTFLGTLAENVISADHTPVIFEGRAKRMVSKMAEFLVLNPESIAPTWQILTNNELTIWQKAIAIRQLGWTETLIIKRGFRSLYILGRLLAT